MSSYIHVIIVSSLLSVYYTSSYLVTITGSQPILELACWVACRAHPVRKRLRAALRNRIGRWKTTSHLLVGG